MEDFGKFLLYLAAVFGGILLLALAGADLEGRYECYSYQKVTGIETKWRFLNACYVKTPNGWQRWDEYKLRNITHQ